MNKIFNLFDIKQKVNYRTEFLSGITVALALVPEAIAFALEKSINKKVLTGSLDITFFRDDFGRKEKPLIPSVTNIDFSIENKKVILIDDVFFTGRTVRSGLDAIMTFGRPLSVVPHSVMFGFVNGLAIVIFLSQLDLFKETNNGTSTWMALNDLLIMIGFVLLTMIIIWGLPKITKAIPSSLAAIIVVSVIIIGFGIDTKTVSDTMDGKSMAGGFPIPGLPDVPFSWETLTIIFPYALIVAGVGLIESLLTLNLIDEITQTRGRGNKECVAQGTANIFSGLFLGMGGCAMIGQSLINISSGARARLSGIVAAVGLLTFIMFGAPIIEQLPMAALVGVMFMVSIGTFEWASLQYHPID